jgi:hypothetical protein
MRRRRLVTVLLSIALASTACATTPAPSPSTTSGPATSPNTGPTPTTSAAPTASGDADEIYDAIEAQVVELRGLQPESAVPRQTLDEAELRVRIGEIFEKDNPPDYVAGSERLLKAFGLLAEEASLKDTYLDLLGGQVAGFYDPDAGELFVISRSGSLGPTEKVTFAHEFTHALQDQHFDYWRNADDWRDNSDLALARTALSEGDATLLMTLWSQDSLSPEELQQMYTEDLDPESLAALLAAPAILRETLLFPYTSGLNLVLGIQAAGGWASVDAAYDRPPDSTEQVLHPDKYADAEKPESIDLPSDAAAHMGDGWQEALRDTLGELQLSIWLKGDPASAEDAVQAAAGWNGDRVVVLTGSDDAWAVASVSEWDSPDDAAEFADAATLAYDALGRPGGVIHQPGSTGVTILIASDEDAALGLDRIFGATGV